MRTAWLRAVALFFALIGVGGAGTETQAQYSRRTPIVEAVEKTRAGIVVVKVEKKTALGRKNTLGSGIIVDERGYVVTNHHVVDGASSLWVQLFDKTELVATLLVKDAEHDLAVLRVRPEGKLTALAFGPGSDLMVGERVIAVGHPYGYANTVSEGIISFVGRVVEMPDGEVLTNLIQVTASINPGNSGGPLLNINGEVIGVNVALRENAQGIAFALNSDVVQQVLSRHLSALKLSGVRHGLKCRTEVKPEGLDRQRLIVDQVGERGAVRSAGLEQGDALVRVAGRAVANPFDLERALWDHKAGDKVDLVVARGGRQVQAKLTLASAEDRVVSQK